MLLFQIRDAEVYQMSPLSLFTTCYIACLIIQLCIGRYYVQPI